MARLDEAADSHIRARGIRLAFGERAVFDGLDLDIPRGRITVVLGGSGGGKSSLLRLIGGLVRPQSGTLLVDGHDVARLDEDQLGAVRKNIGMLFQGGALLDSLTVFDNLALPLREHDQLAADELARRVCARLDDVGLPDAAALLPSQLSGGMLRRAALARALIRDPAILLCDEPFSGLDPASVQRIERLLVEIQQRRSMTLVVVSHHIASTLRMADQIILLLPGRCWQGSARDLLETQDGAVRTFFEPSMANVARGAQGEPRPLPIAVD